MTVDPPCQLGSNLPVGIFPRETAFKLFCWAILVILDQPKRCLFVYFQDHWNNKQLVTYMMSMYNLHLVNQMIRGWGNLHFFLEDFYCIISLDALRNPTRLLSLNLETPLQTRWCETEGSKFDQKIGNKNVGKLAFFGEKVCTWPCIIHTYKFAPLMIPEKIPWRSLLYHLLDFSVIKRSARRA